MKRSVLAVILAAVMISALTACGGSTKSSSSSSASASSGTASSSAASSQEEETTVENDTTAGGWTINTDLVSKLSDEDQEIFEKAQEGFTGQTFTPVALLGTQVVAGTNYMFLCQGTLVTANPVTDYKVVTVYADLDGNAEISFVADFDYVSYKDQASEPKEAEQLSGGWTMNTEFEVTNQLSEDVQKAYDTATAGNSTAIELLGSQVVSGSNYAVLDYSDSGISISYIYAPLDKDAELSGVYYINLEDYVKE